LYCIVFIELETVKEYSTRSSFNAPSYVAL